MAHIISITDFDTPELDVYARLTENQLVNRADPANALFIAESPLVIGRALESGCVPVSFPHGATAPDVSGPAPAGALPGGHPRLHRCAGGADPADGFPSDPWDAVCHAPPGPAHGGGGVRQRPAHRRAGECHESHQHRGYLPLRRRSGYGCGAAHRRWERPPVPGGLPVSAWAMCFSSHGRICRRRLRGRSGCGGWASRRWPWPCGRTRCF